MNDEHLGFCMKSIKLKVLHNDILPLENFDFSEALESVYPLLEIVFSFLDYTDLKTCCRVKKSWKEVAEKMLRKRNSASWFTCYRAKIGSKLKPKLIRHSPNLNYNNVELGIILCDSRRINSNSLFCVHNFYNELYLSRKTVTEYIEEELIPQDVNYCLIACPKVSSHFNLTKMDDNCHCSLLDGLFLPNISQIRTVMFHCNPLKKNLPQQLETYINHNEEVKCLLLFCTKSVNRAVHNLLKILIPEKNASSVAVGGGVIRGTRTYQKNNPTKRTFSKNEFFCIVFLRKHCSSPEFDAFSYVIYDSGNQFEGELLKFKKQIVLRSKAAVFRVCCSAKLGSEDELLLINKVFPNTPVLGLNADGEIGWNCFKTQCNDNDEPEEKKGKYKYPKLNHQWSTILVVITWGPLSSK